MLLNNKKEGNLYTERVKALPDYNLIQLFGKDLKNE